MKDSFKIRATVPMRGQEVQLSGDIIFMGKDALYHLPAGTTVPMPMPVWDKLTVEMVPQATVQEGD